MLYLVQVCYEFFIHCSNGVTDNSLIYLLKTHDSMSLTHSASSWNINRTVRSNSWISPPLAVGFASRLPTVPVKAKSLVKVRDRRKLTYRTIQGKAVWSPLLVPHVVSKQRPVINSQLKPQHECEPQQYEVITGRKHTKSDRGDFKIKVSSYSNLTVSVISYYSCYLKSRECTNFKCTCSWSK